MSASDWLGFALLIGDVVIGAVCIVLAVLGTWWLLPFGAMCWCVGWLVGKELWADWRT
jgi:hypothetical protein